MAQEQPTATLEQQGIKQRVAASYAATAAEYSTWVLDHPLNQGLFDEFADLLAAELQGRAGMQVLDVASASGEPAATIARALPSATVLATDLAAEFVELGRARAESLRLPNLVCQQADAEALTQFSEGSFDAAVCCMGLMFMDASKALAELRRVLKPGGLLAAAVWQSPEACSFWCDFTVQLAHDIDPGTVAQASEEEEVPYSATRFGDPAALLAALAAAGLGQVECREVMVAYSMSADDWWPSLLHIPGVPIKAAVERAQAKAGSGMDAAAAARQVAERRLRERGWMRADGSVFVPDQGAWMVTAHKP